MVKHVTTIAAGMYVQTSIPVTGQGMKNTSVIHVNRPDHSQSPAPFSQ